MTTKPMKKHSNKMILLRRVLLVAAAVVLGINVYGWNARNLLGNQLPMPFGYGFSVVLSGSMEPTLRVNDLVIIRQTDTVEDGDIIVYQSGDVLIIHRVLTVNGDTIITKGDANNAVDDAIALSDVKGILAVTIPGAGAIVRVLKQPAVASMILVAAIVLAELSFRKDKEKDKQELSELEEEIRALMAEIKEDSK